MFDLIECVRYDFLILVVIIVLVAITILVVIVIFITKDGLLFVRLNALKYAPCLVGRPLLRKNVPENKRFFVFEKRWKEMAL